MTPVSRPAWIGRSASGLVVLFAFAACAGSTGKDKTPSTDVIVSEVDGGTIVGTASPDARRLARRDERRALTHPECWAYRAHLVELLARDGNIDPNDARGALSGNSLELCDQPVYSDEIVDCLLAAKTFAEIPRCMKYGPPVSP